jgi:Tfp pilus assembly protein PilZ
MEHPRDKRKYERIKIDSGKIYDLSEGGIYIQTTEPKQLGSLIAMEIKLFENDKPLLVKGRVIRIIYKSGARQKFPPGMAVQFEGLSEQDREKIRAFLLSKKSAS